MGIASGWGSEVCHYRFCKLSLRFLLVRSFFLCLLVSPFLPFFSPLPFLFSFSFPCYWASLLNLIDVFRFFAYFRTGISLSLYALLIMPPVIMGGFIYFHSNTKIHSPQKIHHSPAHMRLAAAWFLFQVSSSSTARSNLTTQTSPRFGKSGLEGKRMQISPWQIFPNRW